jgi:hypothetical protein
MDAVAMTLGARMGRAFERLGGLARFANSRAAHVAFAVRLGENKKGSHCWLPLMNPGWGVRAYFAL